MSDTGERNASRRHLVAAALFALIACTAAAQSETVVPQPDLAPGVRDRERLTGDWGGARPRMEAAGLKLDLEVTLFEQGLVSGSGPKGYDFGSHTDGFVRVDTAKAGLWQGGGLVAHLEYRSGNLPGSLGGTFFPTNTAMEFPSDSPDKLVASSLYLTQRFGDRASLMIGKINALDLFRNDFFFGGLGTYRFMNAVFAAPPSGLVPPVIIGAIGSYRTDSGSVSLWVYDPVDRTGDYAPSDLFHNGVTFFLAPSWNMTLDGRPSKLSLSGIYTTKSGIDFSEISDGFSNALQPSTKKGSYSVGFQFSHLLHVDPVNPAAAAGAYR